jgi:predicted amidophosphoribosyltransferase
MEVFAKALAKELRIPLLPCLSKSKRTQHDKNAYERMDAPCFVRFKAGINLNGKRLLLLDDVSTTGTTLEMSAYVLRKQGAFVDTFSLAHKKMPSLKR